MKLFPIFQSADPSGMNAFDAGWNDASAGFHKMYRIKSGTPEKRLPSGSFERIQDPETITAETAVQYHRGYESFLSHPCVNGFNPSLD